jgi:hypothetical protein
LHGTGNLLTRSDDEQEQQPQEESRGWCRKEREEKARCPGRGRARKCFGDHLIKKKKINEKERKEEKKEKGGCV